MKPSEFSPWKALRKPTPQEVVSLGELQITLCAPGFIGLSRADELAERLIETYITPVNGVAPPVMTDGDGERVILTESAIRAICRAMLCQPEDERCDMLWWIGLAKRHSPTFYDCMAAVNKLVDITVNHQDEPEAPGEGNP